MFILFLSLALLSISTSFSFKVASSYRRVPSIKSCRLFSSTSSHLSVGHDKVKYEFIHQLNEKLKVVDIVKLEAKINQLEVEMKALSVNQPNYSILMETKELLLKKAIREIEEYKKTESKLDKALGKNLFYLT